MTSKTQDSTLLQLSNVSAGYDDLAVVKDINFSLQNGKIGCLLGSSGCGKSTLLRAIAGLEPIMSGEITMGDAVISTPSSMIDPENRQIGMVFQDLALFPHLNVEQNIRFGLKHWPVAEQKERTHNLLELIGLSELIYRYPHALSGGQQQRIALARAMAPRPKLLLMDEPFSGLDASLREQLVPEVRDILLKENMSGLLVTHDQMEAFAMSDSVALMKTGEIIQNASAYNMYHNPVDRYVADFIGEGDFLHGIILDEKHVQSPLGILDIHKPHNFSHNQAVDILVRPDDLLHDDASPVTAKIISKTFRGSHFFYRVQLDSQQILTCLASSHHNHAIGEPIGIKLDLDHLIMFAQN